MRTFTKRVMWTALVFMSLLSRFGIQEAQCAEPSVDELVERIGAALDSHERSITKSEAYDKAVVDARKSPDPRHRALTGKQHTHYRIEMRYDGNRFCVRMQRWGSAFDPSWNISEEDPNCNTWIWDGKDSYGHTYKPSSAPKNRVIMISRDKPFPESVFGTGSDEINLRGYYSNPPVRVDIVLAGARSLKLREGKEPVGGSLCHVLEADTKYGKYVVWVDPAHGDNIAKAEVYKQKGDISGSKHRPIADESTSFDFVLETTRFAEVDGVWVPMECERRFEMKSPQYSQSSVIYHKRTEVILNPDFDALGSFLPDDIKDGTRARVIHPNMPPGTPLDDYVWKNGKPVLVERAEPEDKSAEEKRAEAQREAQARRLEEMVGDVAPNFTVKTLDGKEFRLSDYRGKVVLLHFWATWSKRCVADAPRLKMEYDAVEAREHFAMISLSLDDMEAPVRRHVEEHSLRWPQACVGRNSQIAADYGVTGVPETIFIGPDGRIIPSDETGVLTILKELQSAGSP